MRAEIVIAIVAMAAATFATRFAAPAFLARSGISPRLARFLHYVPTAMLTALIAPALLAPRGYLEIAGNSYLLAGAVAALLAYWRQPPLLTMGGGMAVMLLARCLAN